MGFVDEPQPDGTKKVKMIFTTDPETNTKPEPEKFLKQALAAIVDPPLSDVVEGIEDVVGERAPVVTAKLKPGKTVSDLDVLEDKLKEEFSKFLGDGNKVKDVQFVEETDPTGEKKVKMVFKVGNELFSSLDGPAFIDQAVGAIKDPVALSDILDVFKTTASPKIGLVHPKGELLPAVSVRAKDGKN